VGDDPAECADATTAMTLHSPYCVPCARRRDRGSSKCNKARNTAARDSARGTPTRSDSIVSYQLLSPRPSGQEPRLRGNAISPHAKLSWRTCSWRNPPILLSHFLNMPLSWSSASQAASSLFTAVAEGRRATSNG